MPTVIWLFVFCAASIGTGGELEPVDLSPAELLSALKAKAEKIQDATFTFNQTTRAMGQEILRAGEVTMKLPDKVHMKVTTAMPMGSMNQSVISDGHILWQISEIPTMGQQIVRFDLTEVDSSDRKGMRTGLLGGLVDPSVVGDPDRLAGRFDIKILGREASPLGETYVLEFNPKKEGAGRIGRIKRWLGAKDGFLYKIEMYTVSGDLMMTQEIKEVRFNTGPSDDLFQFTPPEGAQIQDGNEMMKQIMGKGNSTK